MKVTKPSLHVEDCACYVYACACLCTRVRVCPWPWCIHVCLRKALSVRVSSSTLPTSQLRRFQGFELRSFGVLGQHQSHWTPVPVLFAPCVRPGCFCCSLCIPQASWPVTVCGFSCFHLPSPPILRQNHWNYVSSRNSSSGMCACVASTLFNLWQSYNSLTKFTSRHDMANALNGPTAAVIICTGLGRHHSVLGEKGAHWPRLSHRAR